MIPEGKKHYGLWLRANGQNPICLKAIAADLECLNPKKQPLMINHSPNTPASNTTLSPSVKGNQWQTPKNTTQLVSPAFNASISPTPGFEKPAWNLLIPKHNSPTTDKFNPSAIPNVPLYNNNATCFTPYNDVFYLNFLQKFAFLPALSLKENSGNRAQQFHPAKEAIPCQNLEKMFTPTDQLVQMLFTKEIAEAKVVLNNPEAMINSGTSGVTNFSAQEKGKAKAGLEKKTNASRKRRSTSEKAVSEPAKKPKNSQKSPCKLVSSSTSCMVVVGGAQPRPTP